MPTLQLYNTLTRQVEPLKPLQSPQVKMYACGPTVYNFAHIGNFRSFVFEDLLRRALKLAGFQVRHVMNFTDVDDKTIRGSQKAGLSLREFTQRYRAAFLEDMATLSIETPEVLADATEHVPAMIGMIEKLVANGRAYVSDDGSVYYRISAFEPYGCLAHLDKKGLKAGARVSQDEYDKETFGDFALWKAWSAEDGDVAWDSPWGRGRPGWHIECSAMAQQYLGDQFDLHCGGIDLMFPHHENEIAQTEGVTGKQMTQCWCHGAHLLVDNQKMSKSLGNLYTVRDVLERGYQGRELRYALLSVHYRQQLNFTWKSMDDAKAALGRIDAWRARFAQTDSKGTPNPQITSFWDQFQESILDDLNISGALSHLFDLIRFTNKKMDEGESVAGLAQIWEKLDAVLGLGDAKVTVPQEVLALVDARAAARKAKDFSQSDKLRDQIASLGWQVKDTSKGQEVMRA